VRPDQNIDQQLLDELVEVPANYRRLYQRGGFQGLMPHALQVLAALARAEVREQGRSSAELADELTLDRSSVRHALVQLRSRALVKETIDSMDRRQRLQHITAKGLRLLQRFAGIAR
jgi:DNA-binding MarR family transcriptional regulator